MSEQRSLRIEQAPASSLVRIVWNGGGEVPAALQGTYTTPTAAKQAIAVWEAQNKRSVEVVVKRPDEDQEMVSAKRGRPKAIGT